MKVLFPYTLSFLTLPLRYTDDYDDPSRSPDFLEVLNFLNYLKLWGFVFSAFQVLYVRNMTWGNESNVKR